MPIIFPSRGRLVASLIAVALALGSCSKEDSGPIATVGESSTSAALPAECSYPEIDGPVVETMKDFVDQAEVVALVRLGSTTTAPDVALDDYVAERLIADATVMTAVKGA